MGIRDISFNMEARLGKRKLLQNSQCMTSSTLAERASSRAGCSARQRTTAPSSSLLTGRTSLEMEIHTRLEPEAAEDLLFSCVCPADSSRSSTNHRTVAAGLPPLTMHSSSTSSPAAATIVREELPPATTTPTPTLSPTRWMLMPVGFSGIEWYGIDIVLFFCQLPRLIGRKSEKLPL